MEDTSEKFAKIMSDMAEALGPLKNAPHGQQIVNGLNNILAHYYAMQKECAAAESIIWALLTKAGGEVVLNQSEMIASKQPGCFFTIENDAVKMETTFIADRHRIDTLDKIH